MPADPEITPELALAHRVAGHHLDRRTDPRTAIAACGLQEYPPGQSRIALHARAGDVADDDGVWEELVTVNAMRGSPYVVPRADVRVFTTALVPDEDGLRAMVGTAPAKEVEAAGFTVREALDRVEAAARDGLAGGPLGRDDFHRALRERLPDGLLPWCRGCGSHHVRPGIWRALGPLGVTEMPSKAVWALTRDPGPHALTLDEARHELVRRFLRTYGPATHSQLAAWAQTSPAYAKGLFAAVEDELAPVRLHGRKAWILRDELDRLLDPPAAGGVRMLHGHDPYVVQPDRRSLVPDDALRTALFPAVGRPGVVLHAGRIAGLWRARKKGEVLAITVEWTGPEVDLRGEPTAVARLRGCERATVA